MQEKIVQDSEGDAWFLRNFESLTSINELPVDVDFVCKLWQTKTLVSLAY